MNVSAAPFIPDGGARVEGGRGGSGRGRRGHARGRRRRPRGAPAGNSQESSANDGQTQELRGTGATGGGSTAPVRGASRGGGTAGRGRGRGRGRARGQVAVAADDHEGLGASGASSSATASRKLAEAKSRHRRRNVQTSAKARHASAGDTAPGDSLSGSATELAGRLSESMRQGILECVVCLDRVGRNAALWSCSTCFAIVHLACARRWGRRTDEDSGRPLGFQCPSCRANLNDEDPLQFRCYCGRVKNPPLEAGLVPGSCGDLCLRPRGAKTSRCPHNCLALCHPGPCQPCEAPGISLECACGKEKIARRCGEDIPSAGISCGRVCNEELPACGHRCLHGCHEPGAHGECMASVAVKCYCNGSSTDLPCSLSVSGYSCGNTCGKLLACGTHSCRSTCHAGDCTPCALAPSAVTLCACGKRDLTVDELASRKSCLDPVPSCGQRCGRSLECLGNHSCDLVCGHKGSCGPCDMKVHALCRCGASVIRVRCGDDAEKLRQDLRCDAPCPDRRTCKKHHCGNICCEFRKQKALAEDGVLQTDQLFRTSLSGRDQQRSLVAWRRAGHTCRDVCGRTLACGFHSCDAQCGHADTCAPCGILVRAPLTCACGSASLPAPYRCGTAPPLCTQPCSRRRTECEHPCPDNCHSGPCPPCVVLLRKECMGLHGEARFVPCHVGGPDGIRCHRSCGRPLECSIHACRLECHSGFPESCESSSKAGCSQLCGLPRACMHGCSYPCHPDTACPETPCMESVSVRCSCGRKSEEAPCLRGGARGLVALGDDGMIRLQCDEECEEQRRLTAFAAAIGTTPTSLSAMRKVGKQSGGVVGLDGRTVYARFLLDFATRNPIAVAHFERELASIVVGKNRKVDFGCLPQLYRVILHSLAELYLLDSKSNGSTSLATRRIVVSHRGAGTKPVMPVPTLSEAAAGEERKKREQNSPIARSLLIYVCCNVQSNGMSIEARVRKELSSHASSMKVVGRQPMADIPKNDEGVVVEFSTQARMELVFSSLQTRPGVFVSKPLSQGTRAPSVRPSKAAGSSSEAEGSAEARQDTSWERSRSSSLRADVPVLPSGSVGGASGMPASMAAEDAPDSWEDS